MGGVCGAWALKKKPAAEDFEYNPGGLPGLVSVGNEVIYIDGTGEIWNAMDDKVAVDFGSEELFRPKL